MTQSSTRPYTTIFILGPVIFMLTLVPSMLKAQIKDSMKIQERDSLRVVAKDSVISDKAEIKDSAEVAASDSFFLLRSKGLLRRLARSIVTDTTVDPNLVRIDQLYRRYTGRIIRKIEIRSIDFGIAINDTSRSFKNTLTRWADALHHTTREQVIRNNLFFKVNDTLLPILLADNERHLRDQTYLNDVKIIVKRVMGTRDSVDILVLTKDVLSIGGKLKMSSLNRIETAIREDNFGGTGSRIQVSTYYDQMRSRRFGYGAEYILRNIKGSFIDASLGFLDYSQSFNTYQKQEKTFYTRLIRPLVNPYMKWTYAFEAATHQNYNMYLPDSLYQSDYAYQYYNVDAWVAFNKSAKTIKQFSDDRLRTLIGLRFLHTEFQKIPQKYVENYFYQYADLTGVLANIAIFRQDFYKTQYVYGFGRNEDVPEGIDFSVTTGWTNKNQRIRPYMGLDMQYNYFSKKKNYFNYTLRVGGYSYHKKYEDISMLGNLEFFTRLKQLSKKWKQRTFITAGITTQLKKELNEPLLLESQYGLQEYQDIHLGGDHRLTVKAETVFFNNWSLASFRFAPFVFGNGTLLTPQNESLKQTKFYNSIGGGLRSRNESLVFGTLELKAYYFPHANFNGDRWRVEFNTNIKFKYSTQTIRRPEFIAVN